MATTDTLLPNDHPGLTDPAYRARRAEIADIGAAYRPGEQIPVVRYTDEENEVWRLVSSELAKKHRAHAASEYLEGAAALALPADQVPQLAWVSKRLTALTRFRVEPVPGLVPTRQVLRLARGPLLPQHAVRPPPVGAAVHARARRHP